MPEEPTIDSESSPRKDLKNDMDIALTSSATSRLTKYKSGDFFNKYCSMSVLSNCFDISVFQIHQNVISKQIINKDKNLFCIKNQKISRHLAANWSRINSTLSNVFIFRFCNLMYLFAKRSQQICSCDYGIPNVNNNLPFR